MKLSEAVKPISHFKAHASEVVRGIVATQRPVVITLNGEAKAIIQDLREYEKDQESLALCHGISGDILQTLSGHLRGFRRDGLRSLHPG
jgi:prevent-host-death family protein